MNAGCGRTLLLGIHGCRIVATATELGVVRAELRPDLFRHLAPVSLILFRRIQFTHQFRNDVGRHDDFRRNQGEPVMGQVTVRTVCPDA